MDKFWREKNKQQQHKLRAQENNSSIQHGHFRHIANTFFYVILQWISENELCGVISEARQ